MVICLERGADLHMAQLMPMPLTVSCFSEIHIGFTFLVPAHPGSPGQRAVKRVCVCVRACVCLNTSTCFYSITDGRLARRQLSYNILLLCTAVEAQQAFLTMPVAVQLRVNEALLRVMVFPVETTTPSLSVHV